jgi:hypothetical protein
MTDVSFRATKSTSLTQDDYNQLYYIIVEYIRATADKDRRIYIGTGSAIQLYCEVDASYLIHLDSKGHTRYTMGLHPNGTFYNRSAKQTLVSTSSTHVEMRALYILLEDILFMIYICSELNIPLLLPAVITNGGQLRSRYNLQRGERKPQEVQTLHHGSQLRARATRARFDPSTEDQGRAEQRRPAH